MNPRATLSLTTERLLLKPFATADAPALFGFMRDATAMQHTYVAPSLAHCSARLQAFEALRPTLGVAPWVVRRLTSAEVIGWGGLCVDPDEPHWGLEVLYAFAPAAWGQGHATELVQAALAYAFGPLHAHEVNAFVRPQNEASARVLRKCGLARLRHEPLLERDHYRIRAPQAAAAHESSS